MGEALQPEGTGTGDHQQLWQKGGLFGLVLKATSKPPWTLCLLTRASEEDLNPVVV